MPRGESEGRELGLVRAGMFMVFPHTQLFVFQDLPIKADSA
jgi:hypothetical protein